MKNNNHESSWENVVYIATLNIRNVDVSCWLFHQNPLYPVGTPDHKELKGDCKHIVCNNVHARHRLIPTIFNGMFDHLAFLDTGVRERIPINMTSMKKKDLLFLKVKKP